MDVKNDPKINQWFELMELSEGTRGIYLQYMNYFCECISKTPTDLIDEAIAETKAGKLLSERNTMGYIAKFKKCLKDKDLAPKSQGVALSCVKSFYKAYDIQLSSNIGRVKKVLPLRENQNFLSKEDIVKMVANAKSLRDKAIFLCMATSGMASSEIRNLMMCDITIDPSDIGIISIRREKSQVDYTTFISPEAVAAVKTYFEERNRIEKLKIKGSNDFVFVDYRFGTQLKKITFTLIFWNLAQQLGFTNGDFQIRSRSHALRKYFASTLENAGMPKNKIDFMLGHAPSGTDLAYFKTNIETLKQLYIKFLPYLAFEKTIEVRSLDTKDAERLEALERENQKLKIEMETMIKTMIEVKVKEMSQQK